MEGIATEFFSISEIFTDMNDNIDVNEDNVLLIDGMTKRFRLPGWRIA